MVDIMKDVMKLLGPSTPINFI